LNSPNTRVVLSHLLQSSVELLFVVKQLDTSVICSQIVLVPDPLL